MSSFTAVLEPPVARVDADSRPGIPRLAAVELRKMVDTCAGFWLLLVTGALMTAVVGLTLGFGEAADQTLQDLLWGAIWPASLLLPVVGILLVSSEWSQRTGMITFALVPHRLRVLAAKIGAGVALSIATLVMALIIAVVGTAIAAPGVGGTWSLSPGMLGQGLVYVTSAMLIGIGFGAALLASAPAIVLYFALPIAWSTLGTIPALEGAAGWMDGGRTLEPMTEGLLTAGEWARVVTTVALWIGVPMVIGIWRLIRGEVR